MAEQLDIFLGECSTVQLNCVQLGERGSETLQLTHQTCGDDAVRQSVVLNGGNTLEQACTTYGTRAACGPPGLTVRPATTLGSMIHYYVLQRILGSKQIRTSILLKKLSIQKIR
jgi:hypothetical protein